MFIRHWVHRYLEYISVIPFAVRIGMFVLFAIALITALVCFTIEQISGDYNLGTYAILSLALAFFVPVWAFDGAIRTRKAAEKTKLGAE